MKKLLLCVTLGALAIGCASSSQRQASSNVNSAAAADNVNAAYQIIDQEFENYAVENDGYDRVTPYEEQINSSSYIQSISGKKKQKPAKVTKKTVVDEKGNVLSSGAVAPVMDQEALPEEE